LSDDWESYADGRILSGTEAFRIGFVDELGNFETAVAKARELGGTRKANLIEYQQRYDFTDFFRLFGSAEAKAVKVDLGMELPRLQAGKLYFVAPNLVH
jgi:protease-4